MTDSSALAHWLTNQCQLAGFHMTPLPGDASSRRYFRIQHQQGSYIAMDASLEKPSCVPFVAIAKTLRQHKLDAPDIIASDLAQGFLLLSDLGNHLYLATLNSDNALELYQRALDALLIMQQCQHVEGLTLKPFTADFMRTELNLFKEWFLEKHLSLTISESANKMLTACFTFLADSAASQPYVFMHRDYHSANLMVLPNQRVGILDFQDAFIGPITYDLVSLLRDGYIAWPAEWVHFLVRRYWEMLARPNVAFDEFLRWFDLMGMQRHLKIILTYSRKFRRDQNENYLKHIPRTLNYIKTVSARYPECQSFLYFLQENGVEKCAE